MPNPAPICDHIKANGTRCGSPAVKGTSQCFHHSAVKTALDKVTPLDQISYGSFTPIPFVFPEDRASMQINYFLLLQALNEQRVEKRTAEVMLRLLKSMDKNLGKSGSLVDQMSEGATQDDAPASQEDPSGKPPTSIRDTGRPQPVDESFAHANKVISEVNAGTAGYADYREINSLHPAGQRVLNMYFERPMDR